MLCKSIKASLRLMPNLILMVSKFRGGNQTRSGFRTLDRALLKSVLPHARDRKSINRAPLTSLGTFLAISESFIGNEKRTPNST